MNKELRIKNGESRIHNSLFALYSSVRRGFTLIETILVIAVLGLLFALSAPLYQSFQVRNDLLVAVDTFSQSAARAQALAAYMSKDSSWGVKVTTSGGNVSDIVLFKGSSYAGRDSDYDEVFPSSSSLQVSGDTEIVFVKFTGELSAASSNTTFSSSQIGGASWSVAINKKGKTTITAN